MSNKEDNKHYSRIAFIRALMHASELLDKHKEDVNRLNVFPVPDGDTGTNMSLTLQSVVDHVKRLGNNPSVSDLRKAVTTGALMGARGNSGVITSQILRGLSEGLESHEFLDTQGFSVAFSRAEEVAFAAVRHPVEGTILTVLKDSAKAARYAFRKKYDTERAIKYISEKAHDSVENTPNLLPVLKENNVVDAGGYGLAIIIDGVASSLTGQDGSTSQELDKIAKDNYQPKVEIEQINDWAGSKYRYCNEFLVDSDCLNIDNTLQFLSSIGDCELCVGASPKYKVHVHSDSPHKVLEYFVNIGQISEVFIHNMQIQSMERSDKLNDSESAPSSPDSASSQNLNKNANQESKNIGIIAVAPGSGSAEILKELGVDYVVSGGQTMNPSTKDLVDAANSVNAKHIIFLPNNKNIILSAKSACDVLEIPAAVCETKDVLSAFSAMMCFDPDSGLKDNLEAMKEAFEALITAEITFAIKDSKDAYGDKIKQGDCIGINNGNIISSGKNVLDVVLDLLEKLNAKDMDMMTLLYGSDVSQKDTDKICNVIEEKYPDIEIDIQEGGQPLYPIIFSLE